MPNQDQALKGILKSLKAINAALGTVANNDLAEDIQAAITAELASNVVLDTATSEEATSNALLDTLVTSEGAVNTVIDNIHLSVGTPSGTNSVATQFTQLWAVLEGV